MLPPLPGLEPKAAPAPVPKTGNLASTKSLPALPGLKVAAGSVDFSPETASKPSINPAELALAIPQGAARAGASVALTAAELAPKIQTRINRAFGGGEVPNYFENTPGKLAIDETAPKWQQNLQKAVFGDQPLESYQERIPGNPLTKLAEMGGKSKGEAYLAGFIGTISADALNFLGGEGESEKLVAQLAKETNAAKVVNNLINRGFSLDVARSVAPEIAESTSTHAIEDILSHATEIQKAGKIPKSTQIIPKAIQPAQEVPKEFQPFLKEAKITPLETASKKFDQTGTAEIIRGKNFGIAIKDEGDFISVRFGSKGLTEIGSFPAGEKNFATKEEAFSFGKKLQEMVNVKEPAAIEETARIKRVGYEPGSRGIRSAPNPAADIKPQLPTDRMDLKTITQLKQALLATKDELAAKAILREAGYSTSVASRYADDFVRATKPSEVKSALSEINYESMMEHQDLIQRGVTEGREYFDYRRPSEVGVAAEERVARGKAAFEAGATGSEAPLVQTDRFAQARALAETAQSQLKRAGYKGFSTDLKGAFEDWVNERRASKLAGFLKAEEFQKLDGEGLAGIFEFQKKKGELSGEMTALKNYFNESYLKLKRAGLKLGYKENYLPQLWNNSEGEIGEVIRKLGLKPSFTLESTIENYEKGIAAGLTPRFTKLSEIAGWYEQRVQKAVGDRKFFDFLAQHNFVQPATQAPIGWKTLNPDHFPFDRVRYGDVEYTGVLKAPPELARTINNYLQQPEGFWASVARFTTAVKNIVLTSGIPETGVNAHGLNILARNTLSANNPIGGFLRGSYYLANPAAAEAYLIKNSENALFLVQHGLTISTEEHALDVVGNSKAMNWLNRFRNFQSKHFEEPLFNQIIPALKVERANVIFQDLSKSYPPDQAAKLASQITNNIFGGINTEAFGRSREVQNTLRSFILAPDWAESNLRLGGNVVKNIFNPSSPTGKAYRIFTRNLMLAYTAANLTNYASSGHWMWQNDAGHTFEIAAGKTGDGKTRYLRPFGTAADFARLPYDVALAMAKGDFSAVGRVIRNRLSAPLNASVGLVFNIDPFGRPILGKDKYGRQMSTKQQVGGLIGLGSGLGVPQYGQALIDLATGRINVEQAVTQGLELPFRYQSPRYSAGGSNSTGFGKLPGGGSSGGSLPGMSHLPGLPGL